MKRIDRKKGKSRRGKGPNDVHRLDRMPTAGEWREFSLRERLSLCAMLRMMLADGYGRAAMESLLHAGELVHRWNLLDSDEDLRALVESEPAADNAIPALVNKITDRIRGCHLSRQDRINMLTSRLSKQARDALGILTEGKIVTLEDFLNELPRDGFKTYAELVLVGVVQPFCRQPN